MPRGSKRNQRGGYQAPARPAAVSGPGALSARTDGGPAAKQPVTPIPGATYGDRKASVLQQSAAPIVDATAAPAGAPAVGGATDGAAPVPAGIDPFGPTNRPYEPVTAGAALGPGPGVPSESENAADVLRGWMQTHPQFAGTIGAYLEQLEAR